MLQCLQFYRENQILKIDVQSIIQQFNWCTGYTPEAPYRESTVVYFSLPHQIKLDFVFSNKKTVRDYHRVSLVARILISPCDMNIKFLGIVLVCVSYFSFQLTLVECSKETSDYYTHAGFGLAILQLPFALPFYALQAVTSNTGNWIRKGIRRVIRFNRKPVKKTSVAGSDVLEETPETVDDTQVLITEASIVDIAEPKTTESQDSISDRR